MRKFCDLAAKGKNAEGDAFRTHLPGGTVKSCVTVIRPVRMGSYRFSHDCMQKPNSPQRGLVFLHECDLSCPQIRAAKFILILVGRKAMKIL